MFKKEPLTYIEKFMNKVRYLYNNLHYLDYDEREELFNLLQYWSDKVTLNKFELTNNCR